MDAPSQWATMKDYRFRNYNWIGKPDEKIGLIAQEATSIRKDIPITKAAQEGDTPVTETVICIDTNKLMMQMGKALQEALLRIETLEATVATLGG